MLSCGSDCRDFFFLVKVCLTFLKTCGAASLFFQETLWPVLRLGWRWGVLISGPSSSPWIQGCPPQSRGSNSKCTPPCAPLLFSVRLLKTGFVSVWVTSGRGQNGRLVGSIPDRGALVHEGMGLVYTKYPSCHSCPPCRETFLHQPEKWELFEGFTLFQMEMYFIFLCVVVAVYSMIAASDTRRPLWLKQHWIFFPSVSSCHLHSVVWLVPTSFICCSFRLWHGVCSCSCCTILFYPFTSTLDVLKVFPPHLTMGQSLCFFIFHKIVFWSTVKS